jgi:UPF0176 protein
VTVLNIAAYRFVPLDAPGRWRDALRTQCETLGLKGTIIVADEGINVFLAGAESSVDALLDWLASDPRFVDRDGRPAFANLSVKRSVSDSQPFRRLRVKHKREIVTMRRPAVRPDRQRAPAIAPERLAAWLDRGHDDDGRPVRLLDTRNAFEVGHGTFDGAQHLGIARFDEFPAAVDRLRDAWRDETVVTFCTGGIRCEKAALYMQDAGFSRVVQLDGGILDYLQRVGGRHWSGDCFVFDERIALSVDLDPRAVSPAEDAPGRSARLP